MRVCKASVHARLDACGCNPRVRLTVTLALALVALRAESTRAQSPELPIFDTHIHYSSADWVEYPPERILGILQKAGIKRALVSSTPDDGTLTLHQKDPQRIVPILRPYRTREDIGHWWQDPSVLAYVQERLAKNKGVHKGIGEFHLFGGQTGTFVVKRITELAVQENIYLHAHSDELAIVELFTLEPRAARHLGARGHELRGRRRWARCSTAIRASGWTWPSATATWPRGHARPGLARGVPPPSGSIPRRHRHLDDARGGKRCRAR